MLHVGVWISLEEPEALLRTAFVVSRAVMNLLGLNPGRRLFRLRSCAVGDEKRRKQHLVSQGYQYNFADDQRLVSVLNASTGQVVTNRRSTRVNWRESDFLSVVHDSGELDDSLEREFGKKEQVYLNVIREIRPFTRLTAPQRKAIDALTAAHLVRNVQFANRHKGLVSDVAAQSTKSLPSDARTQQVFSAIHSRPPRPGELEGIVGTVATNFASQPDQLAEGIRRVVRGVESLLEPRKIQLIELGEELPGLVLADHPILHGRRHEGRFGFRDAGAIGDADTIFVPLARRVLAVYTATPLSDVSIRTKKSVLWINSLLVRGADHEVVCHPDDAIHTSRLIHHLNRYPPSRFDSVTLR